jgi:hypothetical protein
VTAYKQTEIVCDDCEQAADTLDRTATDARALLRKRGWHYKDRRDICPECWSLNDH